MRTLLSIFGLAWAGVALAEKPYQDFDAPPHDYWQRVPQDRFSQLMATHPVLDTQSELSLLRDLLAKLEIPVSSQLLVYSATSFQSGQINPGNPRGLYFNADTSVGLVPGGRMEIASLDPQAGMVFFIFDRLNPTQGLPRFVRSDRCMNCHADSPSKYLPGLVVQSVAVNRMGGSLASFRHDEMGHTVPLDQRFGGWHLTGGITLAHSHANLVSSLSGDLLSHLPNAPGDYCQLSHYPLPTSDILPHLVHEHQVGFLNHVVEAIYLARENQPERIPGFVRDFAAYITFQNEAALPKDGVVGDATYRKDFQEMLPATGRALGEFDLKSRLFKLRCSYLLLTKTWQAVPATLRLKIYAELRRQLPPDSLAISILRTHLPDWK